MDGLTRARSNDRGRQLGKLPFSVQSLNNEYRGTRAHLFSHARHSKHPADLSDQGHRVGDSDAYKS